MFGGSQRSFKSTNSIDIKCQLSTRTTIPFIYVLHTQESRLKILVFVALSRSRYELFFEICFFDNSFLQIKVCFLVVIIFKICFSTQLVGVFRCFFFFSNLWEDGDVGFFKWYDELYSKKVSEVLLDLISWKRTVEQKLKLARKKKAILVEMMVKQYYDGINARRENENLKKEFRIYVKDEVQFFVENW